MSLARVAAGAVRQVLQVDGARRLVRVGERALHLAGQVVGAAVVPGRRGAADLGQPRSRGAIVPVAGHARPEGVLVDRDRLGWQPSVEKGAERPVTQRQAVEEPRRRRAVAQDPRARFVGHDVNLSA
jgi:hypothetical protein